MLPDTPDRICTRCGLLKPLVLFGFVRGQTGPGGNRIATCTPCALNKQAQKKQKTEESKKQKQAEADKESGALFAAVNCEIDVNTRLSDIGLEDFLTIVGGHRGSIQLEASVDLTSLEKSASRKEKADKLAQHVWEAMNLRFVYVYSVQFYNDLLTP